MGPLNFSLEHQVLHVLFCNLNHVLLKATSNLLNPLLLPWFIQVLSLTNVAMLLSTNPDPEAV